MSRLSSPFSVSSTFRRGTSSSSHQHWATAREVCIVSACIPVMGFQWRHIHGAVGIADAFLQQAAHESRKEARFAYLVSVADLAS